MYQSWPKFCRMWLPRLLSNRSLPRLSGLRLIIIILRPQVDDRHHFIIILQPQADHHYFPCGSWTSKWYFLDVFTYRQMSSSQDEIAVNLPMIRKMERICRFWPPWAILILILHLISGTILTSWNSRGGSNSTSRTSWWCTSSAPPLTRSTGQSSLTTGQR